ncbi:hypothetical protein [Zarconia navalis]|nr:hypothetical protein [Zarconia navalis]
MQVLKTWAIAIVLYFIFWASMGRLFAHQFMKFITQSTVLV